MEVVRAILGIHESDKAATAFAAMLRAFADLPLHCAGLIEASELALTTCWPEGRAFSAELSDTAAHVLRPEVFLLNPQFPAEAAAYGGGEALLLPIRADDAPRSAVVLVAPQGSFGEDPEPWEQLCQALGQCMAREQRLRSAEEEREQLRRRAEESEALHTLGLATNRTLELDEVLNLVARFTRTLLGAHYAAVHTLEDGTLRMVSAVGLRTGHSYPDQDRFAVAVVKAGKPVIVGCGDPLTGVDDFPLHLAEGMQTGVGIPLTLFGGTFGALLVGYRRDYDITGRDIRLGLTLASHAAVAISNARLHEEVARRSDELASAYARLDEMTRAKERFYNAVSHDLRTPVSAIRGYTELMLEGSAGELPGHLRRFVANTGRAADSLLTLVNDLLDFAKLQAGKLTVELKPCSLARVIEDSLATVRPQAEDKGLALHGPAAADLPELLSDAARLRQILVNLLSNAVKFTETGEVRVTVRAIEGDGTNDERVEIRVSDTGPGIREEDRERIFAEFEQIEGSVGTGLGLPISRNLAHLLGGRLLLESEVGRGSTFILQLGSGASHPYREYARTTGATAGTDN